MNKYKKYKMYTIKMEKYPATEKKFAFINFIYDLISISNEIQKQLSFFCDKQVHKKEKKLFMSVSSYRKEKEY